MLRCTHHSGVPATRRPSIETEQSMIPDQMNILLVVGAATPPGRLSRAVDEVEWCLAARRDIAVDVVDLAKTPVDVCDGRADADYGTDTRNAVLRVERASAIILASPVYRASIPGVLKNLLDLIPVAALRNKPVGIIAMGGSDHHYLSVDSHLRSILAWFGALVAPTSVYLTSRDFADGQPSAHAIDELTELADTVVALAQRLSSRRLGPPPLAERAWQ